MVRRRVVLTGNSGWTTRIAANSSRYFPSKSSTGPVALQKPKKKKVRVAKPPSPEKLKKQRAVLQTLLTKMRAAREDGNYAVIPPLWGQAKTHLRNAYGAKAAQLGIYKEMNSHYNWARSVLNAEKKARKGRASLGTTDPSSGPIAKNPPRPGRTDVRAGRCIHDLITNQCAHCFPAGPRKVSSPRSTRRGSQ